MTQYRIKRIAVDQNRSWTIPYYFRPPPSLYPYQDGGKGMRYKTMTVDLHQNYECLYNIMHVYI